MQKKLTGFFVSRILGRNKLALNAQASPTFPFFRDRNGKG